MVTFERLPEITIAHIPPREFATDADAQRIGEQLATELLDHPCHRLVIDLTGVRGSSSRLLGKIVTIRRRQIEAGGTLELKGLSELIRHQLTVTKLDTLFEIIE